MNNKISSKQFIFFLIVFVFVSCFTINFVSKQIQTASDKYFVQKKYDKFTYVASDEMCEIGKIGFPAPVGFFGQRYTGEGRDLALFTNTSRNTKESLSSIVTLEHFATQSAIKDVSALTYLVNAQDTYSNVKFDKQQVSDGVIMAMYDNPDDMYIALAGENSNDIYVISGPAGDVLTFSDIVKEEIISPYSHGKTNRQIQSINDYADKINSFINSFANQSGIATE